MLQREQKERIFQTSISYDIQDIYTVLKNSAHLPFEPFLSGKGKQCSIYVNSPGFYDVNIYVIGKKIYCREIYHDKNNLSDPDRKYCMLYSHDTFDNVLMEIIRLFPTCT